MIFKRGRYSGFLRPISYVVDLLIIHLLAKQFFIEDFQFLSYVIIVTIAWIILSVKSNFYEIYRFTQVNKIMSLIGKQGAVFFLIVFAFFGFYNEIQIEALAIFRYFLLVMLFITIAKFAIYYLLKKYRLLLQGNLRKVAIIGLNQKTDQLRKFFEENPEYGYRLFKTFEIKGPNKSSIQECIDYISKNGIEEIYTSVAEISNNDLAKLIDFADNNLKILKFLPDNKEIYSKKLDFTYYGFLPILSMRKIPMDEPFNKFVKRSFDIILSIFIIVGVLSWLTPILGLIIKLESRGPGFF